MGQKIMWVAPETFLAPFLSGDSLFCKTPQANVTLVRASHDPLTDRYALCLECPDWEEVRPGVLLPEFVPVFGVERRGSQ